MSLREKLGLKSVADVPAQNEALREQEREYNRARGRLLEDERHRLDAAAATWRMQLKAHVRDGIPDGIHHPNAPQIAALLSLLTGAGQPVTLGELLDELGSEGELDVTPRAEVDAQLAEFARKRKALKLAAEEASVEQAEAEAKAQREQFDRRAAEELGK